MEDVIRQALDELPDLPWKVAQYLTDRAYFGRPRKPQDCPVHRYVTTALFRAGYFEVGRVKVSRRSVRGLGAKVPMPWAVRSFVREFDLGWYPRLVAEF